MTKNDTHPRQFWFDIYQESELRKFTLAKIDHNVLETPFHNLSISEMFNCSASSLLHSIHSFSSRYLIGAWQFHHHLFHLKGWLNRRTLGMNSPSPLIILHAWRNMGSTRALIKYRMLCAQVEEQLYPRTGGYCWGHAYTLYFCVMSTICVAF